MGWAECWAAEPSPDRLRMKEAVSDGSPGNPGGGGFWLQGSWGWEKPGLQHKAALLRDEEASTCEGWSEPRVS